MRGRAIAWVSFLCLGATSVKADVWEQLPTSATPGLVVSSCMQYNLLDPSGEDQVCFDDFSTGPTSGWLITSVTAFGTTIGPTSAFIGGARLVIQQFPSATNPGMIYAMETRNVSVLSSGNALFTGMALGIPQGRYWLGIYLKSINPHYKWKWRATDANGNSGHAPEDPAIAHNPMGALTGTSSPVRVIDLVGERNLAFRIETAPFAPEPATWVAFAGGLFLVCRRRR